MCCVTYLVDDLSRLDLLLSQYNTIMLLQFLVVRLEWLLFLIAQCHL